MHNLLFVIVLYNARFETTNTYLSLICKLDGGQDVFIFDNSPVPQHRNVEFEGSSICYVSDTTNPGLSYAYNQAARYAFERGIEWMMLLDQDTRFSIDTIGEFEAARVLNFGIKLFVPPVKVDQYKYMSPVVMRCHTAKMAQSVPSGVVSSLRYAPINSGMIVNVEALQSVGGYNEKVPLDYSDYQFMERFKRKYQQFYVLDTSCQQEFSNLVQNREQKLARFAIFCRCLKNCDRFNFSDKLSYLCIVLKRAISIAINSRSGKSFLIMFKNYF